jgi:hypothetical protein
MSMNGSAAQSFAQPIAVIAGLRRAFAKIRHHAAFTRRVKPIIEAELPGYTVSVDPDHYGLRTVRVWGNGLPYDSGVYLCWNGSKPWAEGMAEAIEIADYRDYAERTQAEEPLKAKLDALNAQVEAARAEAAALIAALPVPASATIRAESHFWSSPTSETSKAYPLLFGSVR